MQVRDLIDVYGKPFKNYSIINGNQFDLDGKKNLEELTDEEISSQIVLIPGENDQHKVYFLSQLQAIFRENYYIRLLDPETGEDLLEKLPDFKRVVTQFEKYALDYNVKVLEKYPHFVEILKNYVKIALAEGDMHFYPKDNRNWIASRLEKEFYPILNKFTSEEREAFHSLFITNRQEYEHGELVEFPAIWKRTEENEVLYDGVSDNYQPYPYKNVILADAFTHPESGHLWGMDVLHLLLQYHAVRTVALGLPSKTEPLHTIFDHNSSPFAYNMEQTLRIRTKKEMKKRKAAENVTNVSVVFPEKGEAARQSAQQLSAKIFLKNDILKNQHLFEHQYWNRVKQLIQNDKDSEMDADKFISALVESCDADPDQMTGGETFFHTALSNCEGLIQNWPTLSSVYDLLIAQQKKSFIYEVADKIPPELKDTIIDLFNQINESDPATSLSDILKEGSLFLAVDWYNKTELNKWLKKHNIYACVNDTNQFIDQLKPFKHSDLDDLEEKIAPREESLAIHAELIKDRQDYIKHGYGSQVKQVSQLINDATDTFNRYGNNNRFLSLYNDTFSRTKNVISRTYDEEENGWADINTGVIQGLFDLQQTYTKRRHRNDIRNLIGKVQTLAQGQGHRFLFVDMMKKIQDAYNVEKENYTSNVFSMFRSLSFEDRLAKNDNDFCYPRGLKAILDKYNVHLEQCKENIRIEQGLLETFVPKKQ